MLWREAPVARLEGVRSPTLGEIRRDGVGSGRSGNHCGGAWAILLPIRARPAVPEEYTVRPIDLAATVCALLDVPHDDLHGTPLLTPPMRG